MILIALIKYVLLFFMNAVLYIFTFISGWGMHIQNNNITPATSYFHTADILPLTDSILLPADMISLSTVKGLSLTDK
jgi:hypothetical protein